MKINIRTVFKTENCGSYLQAWALKEQLSSMGHEVFFSDYKSATTTKSKLINILKCYIKLNFKRGNSLFKKTLAFNKERKAFAISKNGNDCDLCFFGSDTLWNFEDKFFVKNVPFFTGEDVIKPCYTYSMSIGSTGREDFINNERAVSNIQKFKKLAVRDDHTKNVLSEIYPVDNIVKTVDPTMLLDKEVYIKKFTTKNKITGKYLLVYYFGDMTNDLWTELRSFADKNSLKIVNVGFYDNRFDINLPFAPKNFITAFIDADYVFTNTFHGCIFSTIFNKQFATNGIHKKKIESLLNEFSLNSRIATIPKDLERVFMDKVDYETINTLIQEKRNKSIEYLNEAIKEVNCNE